MLSDVVIIFGLVEHAKTINVTNKQKKKDRIGANSFNSTVCFAGISKSKNFFS